MDRAIVLIGVSRTRARLDALQAVESAVDLMEQWARGQGIPGNRIVRLTDHDHRPVTTAQIAAAVRHFVHDDPVEQLILYFSGHGCVIGRSEFWLLSDAPYDVNAAVNLEVSIEAATSGSINHVIFISDACRTLPRGVRQGRIHGAGVFPNLVEQDYTCGVDMFYATRLGAPALEVPLRGGINAVYRAIYTDVLSDVLQGGKPQVVHEGFIRPWPLQKALRTLVPAYLRTLGQPFDVNQNPDARICSDGDAWIARFDLKAPQGEPIAPRPGSGPRGGDWLGGDLPDPDDTASPPLHASAGAGPMPLMSAEELVGHVLRHPSEYASLELPSLHALSEQANELLESAVHAAGRQAPRALQACGLVVIGREVRSVVCRDYDGRISERSGVYRPAPGESFVAYRVWEFEEVWGSKLAMLELEDGSGMLIPLFHGCAAMLEWDSQGRAVLHYDPLDKRVDTAGMRELRWLRAVIEAAAKRNVFELDKTAARILDRRMEKLPFVDPAMALYAAYAYREIGEIGRIRSLQHYVFQSLGVRLFDLALLSRDMLHRDVSAADFAPPAPLHCTGWILMDALGRHLPEELRELRQYDTGELWAHYSPEGLRRLRALLDPAAGTAEVYQEPAPWA